MSHVVALLEKELGGQAKVELAPMQSGDVPETKADVDDLTRDVGFRPATPFEEGAAGLPRGTGNFMHRIDRSELISGRSNPMISVL